MKKSVLSQNQMFALGRYLGTIEEKLKGEGPSFATVAEWAAKALGHPVSERNVQSVAEAAHVTWDVKQGRQSPKLITALKGRVGDLERRLTQAEANLAQLRGLIHHLYQEFDAKPPAGLAIPTAPGTVAVAGKS